MNIPPLLVVDSKRDVTRIHRFLAQSDSQLRCELIRRVRQLAVECLLVTQVRCVACTACAFVALLCCSGTRVAAVCDKNGQCHTVDSVHVEWACHASLRSCGTFCPRSRACHGEGATDGLRPLSRPATRSRGGAKQCARRMRRTLARLVRGQPMLLPAMSPTMESGQIVRWAKQPGDAFTAGETLFVIETDKATLDVDATDDGVIARLLVPAGRTVAVNSPIALTVSKGQDWKTVEWEGATAAAPQPQKQQQPQPQQPQQSTPVAPASVASAPAAAAPSGRKTSLVFPSVVRLLTQYGLDATQIVPRSGLLGQLLKGDVLRWIAANGRPQPNQQQQTIAPVAAAAAVVPQLGNPKAFMAHSYSSVEIDLSALRSVFGDAAVPVGECVKLAARRAQREVPSVVGFSVLDLFSSGVSAVTGIIDGANGANVALAIGGRRLVLGNEGDVRPAFTLTLSADAALLDDAERFLSLVHGYLAKPNEIF